MGTAPVRDALEASAVEEAAGIIRRGGLVAFPTETVYGLGADACNPEAVARIFEAKARPTFDPLIVHISDPAVASQYGDFSHPLAPELISRFWPGPLTLVVNKTERIPSIVTAGLDTVAIRNPAHPVALSLIRESRCAIAAPSANLFGRVSPTDAPHVAEQLADRVDLILDGGACSVGIESTILDLTGSKPTILRAGGVPPEALEPFTGPLAWSTSEPARPLAPGQLPRHYGTLTPLQILPENLLSRRGSGIERVGLLCFTSPKDSTGFVAVEVLSDSGDLREAAVRLFAALRRLDSLGLDRLVATPVPEQGLGIAIMDRLRRCATLDSDIPAAYE